MIEQKNQNIVKMIVKIGLNVMFLLGSVIPSYIVANTTTDPNQIQTAAQNGTIGGGQNMSQAQAAVQNGTVGAGQNVAQVQTAAQNNQQLQTAIQSGTVGGGQNVAQVQTAAQNNAQLQTAIQNNPQAQTAIQNGTVGGGQNIVQVQAGIQNNSAANASSSSTSSSSTSSSGSTSTTQSSQGTSPTNIFGQNIQDGPTFLQSVLSVTQSFSHNEAMAAFASASMLPIHPSADFATECLMNTTKGVYRIHSLNPKAVGIITNPVDLAAYNVLFTLNRGATFNYNVPSNADGSGSVLNYKGQVFLKHGDGTASGDMICFARYQ